MARDLTLSRQAQNTVIELRNAASYALQYGRENKAHLIAAGAAAYEELMREVYKLSVCKERESTPFVDDFKNQPIVF